MKIETPHQLLKSATGNFFSHFATTTPTAMMDTKLRTSIGPGTHGGATTT